MKKAIYILETGARICATDRAVSFIQTGRSMKAHGAKTNLRALASTPMETRINTLESGLPGSKMAAESRLCIAKTPASKENGKMAKCTERGYTTTRTDK